MSLTTFVLNQISGLAHAVDEEQNETFYVSTGWQLFDGLKVKEYTEIKGDKTQKFREDYFSLLHEFPCVQFDVPDSSYSKAVDNDIIQATNYDIF